MKLGLGTVQFGLSYGISNTLGKVAPNAVREILALAAKRGVESLDTAADYGDSETVLGQCLRDTTPFRIVTKTSGIRAARLDEAAITHVVENFHRSLQRLGQPSIHGLLVHHADDLLAQNGAALWSRLEELRAAGFVQRIGVSVYNPDELRRVADAFPIGLVQAPINVFDQRFPDDGILRQLKAAGVEVHARSVFLQGLLLMNASTLPPALAALRPTLESYRGFLTEHQMTPMQGALRFGSQLADVDCWMVGVCSPAQLGEVLDALPAANAPQLDFAPFAIAEEKLINPAKWNS